MAEHGKKIPRDLQDVYEAGDLEVRALLDDLTGVADWVPVARDLKHLVERLRRAEAIVVEAKKKIDQLSRGHLAALRAAQRLEGEAEDHRLRVGQLENQVRRLRRQRDIMLETVQMTDELTERLDAVALEPDTTEPGDGLFSANLRPNGVS